MGILTYLGTDMHSRSAFEFKYNLSKTLFNYIALSGLGFQEDLYQEPITVIVRFITFFTKCVHPAGYFLNRMLALLRSNTIKSTFTLTTDFFKDLNWFLTFWTI